MRKIIAIVIISAAFVMSGISATTFSAGQVTSHVWAEGGE